MKYLQRLLVLFTISAAMFSCQKEYSIENATGSNTPTAQWEFKEGGVQFKGPIDSVAIDTIGTYKFLSMYGRSDDGSSQITLQAFRTDLALGTYKTPFSLFAYLKAGTLTYQTDQTAVDSFTITITKLDSNGVTGTFSGNALTGNTIKKIVDGKFNALFKKATTVPPSANDSGQVVLWSKAGCGGGANPIAVTVGGNKTGSITKFFTAGPATCDPAGAFFVKLPVGTYPWVAKCGTDSVTGTVTVTKGGCTKQEVSFTSLAAGDYFPTTTNSNWSYLYANSTPGDTIYTISTGIPKSFLGKSYILFTNTDGTTKDSSYYRKTTGYYYEYVAAITDTAAGGISIPAFEYTFLRDNVIKGFTYSSTPVTATVGGVPVSVLLNSTVLDNTTTIQVNGQTLPVIKMRHVYTYKLGTVSTDFYAIEEWFAKGVGLITYFDYATPPFTTPSDELDLTRATIF